MTQKQFPDPLLKIEHKFWNIIISMSKCHHIIRVLNRLQMINYIISNMQYQVRLNSSKGQRCGLTKEDGEATVVKLYWSDFMTHNGRMLNHVRTHTFGLDRTNEWKYGVFFDMCDSIDKALIGAKATTISERPEWKNKNRNGVVFELDSFWL